MKFWFYLLIAVLTVILFSGFLGCSPVTTRVISCIFALVVITVRRLILIDAEAYYARITNSADAGK